MDVLLAQPRGFCAGVVRAIDTVEQALNLVGPPVYVYHAIVHNGHVVAALQQRGAVFVDDLAAVPPGATTVFSAHGVGRAVREAARDRGLRVIDATCPLVDKVHQQALRYQRQGRQLLVIGHAGHDEVVGLLGALEAPAWLVTDAPAVAALPFAADAPLAYVTQTTLSMDDTASIITALQARFANLSGPALSDICYATQNRQNAVRLMAPLVDRVLIVGDRGSSNSCRLREVAEQHGVPARLVEHAGELDPAWLAGARRIGLSAGASTPDEVVRAVCRRLRALGAESIRQLPGRPELVQFERPALQPPPEAARPQPRPDSRSANRQAGAPIAAQSVSVQVQPGSTSAWNRPSNVAAK